MKNSNKPNTKHSVFNRMYKIAGAALLLAVSVSCSSDGSGPSSPDPEAIVRGSVKDANGNAYPNTLVLLSNESQSRNVRTNAEGNFIFDAIDIGATKITIAKPLSTSFVSDSLRTVNVQDDQGATVDFVIRPESVTAHLNFGTVDIFNEIRNNDGNIPADPNEPLYAANYFQEPFGLLTAITAPDDHNVTLSEWQTASGSMLVRCNGDASTVNIALEGLIPKGTYSFFLAFLNKKKSVGESINFATDLVNPSNPPLGSPSGTDNVQIAGSNGAISASIQHASCILTDQPALVIPVIYHINGNTFGGGEIPDVEEAAHLLVYFQ